MNSQHMHDHSDYLANLSHILEAARNEDQLFRAIVDAPFHDRASTTKLSLGIVVLLLVNTNEKTIDRVALSDTEHAEGAQDYSVKPFREIKIPVGSKDNIIAEAIDTGRATMTDDWQYMFKPVLTAQEARFNQAGAGIGFSVVYPLVNARDGGALIFSYFEPPDQITKDHHSFMNAYRTLVSQRLSS